MHVPRRHLHQGLCSADHKPLESSPLFRAPRSGQGLVLIRQLREQAQLLRLPDHSRWQ